MNERTKAYRVKRFRWRDGEPYLDKVMYLTEPVYKQAMKRKKHPSGSGDVWFEDYAHRWYEFHGLRRFLSRLNVFKNAGKNSNRLTKLRIRTAFIILILGFIIALLTFLDIKPWNY